MSPRLCTTTVAILALGLLAGGCASADWHAPVTEREQLNPNGRPYPRASIDNLSIDQRRDDSIRMNQDRWSKRR